MEKKKLLPELRFPEFKGRWEEKRLDKLLEFKNGINASKDDYGFGYKFINVMDIIENDFITYDKIRGEVNVSQEVFEKSLVQYGDILFQRSSETREEVGQSNVYLDREHSATFGGFVIRGKKIGEYEPFFFHQLLKTSIARKEITTKSGGSTRYNIGQDILSSVKLSFPSLPEQQKIAKFLTAIDSRIQNLEKKKSLLEEYKKGMMQQIFKQEIRFKDENGKEFPKWEQKKLGVICEIVKGKQLNKEELTESGTYPCQNGGISPSGYTEEYNTAENTITVSEGGNSCGYVNFLRTKFWCGGHCYSLLKIKSDIEVAFLFQYLKYNEKWLMRMRVGSGLPNIQKKDITKFKIQFPIKEEQTKIADFLSAIDKKIGGVADQIEKTKPYKKGLMQQMFV